MSAAQKKVIDDHCTNEWALQVASPWADFEHAGRPKLKADPAHEVYTITAEQLAEWKKAAEPLVKTWADGVKKAGGDPDAIMKELKDGSRSTTRPIDPVGHAGCNADDGGRRCRRAIEARNLRAGSHTEPVLSGLGAAATSTAARCTGRR